MGEKCCLCFPLDCGVKTLAVLTVLGSIGLGVQIWAQAEWREIFLPHFVATTILALVWIMAWVSPTESAKNMLFLAYVVCNLVFNEGYKAYNLLNGKLEAYNCRPEQLSQWNQDVTDIEAETDIDLGGTLTYDECVEKSTPWLWADFAVGLLFSIYFTFVIMKWSKTSDGYAKI